MQIALIAARTLQFWAVAVLFGGAGFTLLLGRSTRHGASVLGGAALVTAISGAAWFGLVFVALAGGPESLIDLDAWSGFASAPFGPPWLLRLPLLGAAALISFSTDRRACVLVGVLLLADQAWLGHAANGQGLEAVWQIGFYWLHVFAGSSWIGALVMLCVVTFDERRVPRDGLWLFSSLGLGLVAVIIASGLVNASLRGVTLAGLLGGTAYGRLLAVKVFLFVVMLGLATFNRTMGSRIGEHCFIFATVGLETLLGLVVLAVAAVLGITSPS